ncbi:transcriptional repressor [soil metagenome]
MTHNQIPWESILWKAGHRVTRQRALILDAVCSGGGHTPLSDICGRVRKLDATIDRSTLYRTLRLFVELGIVVAADTGGAETEYEIAKVAPHHHLVCRGCGSEQEISAHALEAMVREVRSHHQFQIETDHLVLFGYCDACRPQTDLDGH